jgi:hypothetical protein
MSGDRIVRFRMGMILLAALAAAADVHGQQPPRESDSIKMTFVPLTQDANALIAEPPRKDRARSRIAMLIAHPEHINMFNDDFLAPYLARRGYRTMMMNYYGKEATYEEFLAPLAAAMRYLKNQPGIEKIVLVGHSSGGAELTFYQDVAENGPKACQRPERIYPCDGGHLDNLPKADGIMLLDINIGGPLRAIGIDPAVDNDQPSVRDPEFDMFDPHNGFDASTHTGRYSPEFERRFFAAQQARNERLLYDGSKRS